MERRGLHPSSFPNPPAPLLKSNAMLNIEELIALARRAEFDTTIAKAPEEITTPSLSLSFHCGDFIEDGFSLCVAAPPYEAEDRYRPFNLKSDTTIRFIEHNLQSLRAAASALSSNGLMFVYGLPGHLARYATALSDELGFRYWIAVRTMTAQKEGGPRPEHTGLLLMSKPGASLNPVRVPHSRCRCCGETLKDWGGKSHLMHPDGVMLSDVWMDLVVDPQDRMPSEIFDRIIQMSAGRGGNRLLLLIPDAQSFWTAQHREEPSRLCAFDPLVWKRRLMSGTRLRDHAPRAVSQARVVPEELLDRLHRAPCLDVMKQIPSETVDLAFADPPFNLTKGYNGYSDDRDASDYTGWCKRWLIEYERVLKPGGALVVLNLPRWAVWLADFLSRSGDMFLQNWIVWNSLPEPKGILMPAHYALLYFTKGERAATFNYHSMENGWEPFDEAVFPPDRADVCQRRSCIRKRRASGHVWRGELTDVWHDIHRVRRPAHSSRLPKIHPCETPERLIDRITRLTTDANDLVLDCFAGTGATPFVAKRLGRRFIAVEQDPGYLRAAERKMAERRSSPSRVQNRKTRTGVSKRALQIELQRLTLALGRLPTRAEVESLSKYELQAYDSAFDSWSEATRAARVVADGLRSGALAQASSTQQQLKLFEPVSEAIASPFSSSTVRERSLTVELQYPNREGGGSLKDCETEDLAL
ncbi:MAG: site-specific DNA-methyltransferase [Blastocatellia bacterium]|nr:site-specific DNA-methyltransferase [Blastocatellia bacterium]